MALALNPILALGGMALTALLALHVVPVAASDDVAAAGTVVEVREGVVAVTLTAPQVERLALQVAPAAEGKLPRATPGMARVIDLAPLLDLRQKLRVAQANLSAAERRAEGTRQHELRLSRLAQAGAAVGADERRSAESAADAAAADVESLRLERAGLREAAAYQWGARLSRELIAPQSDLLEQLAAHRWFLLLVAPVAGGEWRTAPASLELQLTGSGPAAAQILDEAPAAVAGRAGTWWAVTKTAALRTGMAMAATPADGPQVSGVRVGDASLVWYAGHRWLYVEAGEHRFERREATDPRALGPGEWLVTGLPPQTRIVTTGAQSLLGEELRWSIPTEQDD